MDISTRTIFKVLSVTAAFVGLAYLAYLARVQLGWIFTAAFFAVALNPAVEFFAKFMPKRSRGAAISMVLLVAVGLVTAVAASLVPPLVQQSQQFVKNLPNLSDQLINNSGFVSEIIKNYDLVGRVQQSESQITEYMSSAGGQLLSAARGLFDSMVVGITILGLTFFMLLEGPRWLELAWRVARVRRKEHARELAGKMYGAVAGYVTGNVITSLIAAAAATVVLVVLGVPYAIPLGIIVGVLDLVPLVGATVAALIVVVVALFHSTFAAVFMLIFFLIYQQIENHILQPIVYGKTVQVSPLVVLIAVLVGVAVGGIVGALVGIPVAASLQILAKDYLARRGAAE